MIPRTAYVAATATLLILSAYVFHGIITEYTKTDCPKSRCVIQNEITTTATGK
jgi:hypothetical protein